LHLLVDDQADQEGQRVPGEQDVCVRVGREEQDRLGLCGPFRHRTSAAPPVAGPDPDGRGLTSRPVERDRFVEQPSLQSWIRLLFIAVGVFGAVFAISGLLIGLPKPAVGGTCGPGTASEAPIVAALDPVSIGAGKEPPASDTSRYYDWWAFVGECQASADGTLLAALAILAASAGMAFLGPRLVLGRRGLRRSHRPAGSG
jgi:hypothetical protein